jgi:hypothetical protein
MKKMKVSQSLRPFISVVFIMTTLMATAIIKMESRRLGYQFLKLTKQYKNLRDDKAVAEMELAKLTQPGRIRRYAETRLTLREASGTQVIHFSGQRVALRETP